MSRRYPWWPRPIEFGEFGGLDLRVDAQELGPTNAVDCLNVLFDLKGQVRTRNGTSLWLTAAAVPSILYAWPDPATNVNKVIVKTSANVYVYTAETPALQGSTASTDTMLAGGFAAFASGAGYLATGTTVKKITTVGALTTPAAMPQAQYLAIQTPDNRLVAANGSTVSFSAPGLPEDFTSALTTGSVLLEPNDGYSISGMVAWNNLIFVFKPSKMFVFHGNSTNADGSPAFNYRRVGGQGASLSGSNSTVIACDDGVYFTNLQGLWHTSGGPPVKISNELDPLFLGQDAPPYWTGNTTYLTGRGLCRVGNTLLVAAGPNWFTFDLISRQWGFWSMANCTQVIASPSDSTTAVGVERFLFYGPSLTTIKMMSPASSSDNGTSISSFYRSGFWTPSQPGAEAWVREWLLDGTSTSGAVLFQTAVNDKITLSTGSTVALGNPVVAQGRARNEVARGRSATGVTALRSARLTLASPRAGSAGRSGCPSSLRNTSR